MSRQSRRQARRRKDRRGVIIGILAFFVLAGLFVLGLRPPRDLEPNTNCPLDQQYAAQMAILVDQSDTLTTVQAAVTRQILRFVDREIPETTEIRMYNIGRAGRRDPAPELRICKPAHGDSVSRWTSNPRLVTQNYNENFSVPFQEALSSAVQDVSSDTISPIIEAIQVAAVDAFQPRDSRIPRHLVIVSDMIQNSGDFSFFTDPRDFEILARNPDYGTLRVDLSGVSVRAFLLARRGPYARMQDDSMRLFWEDYFIDQEADPAARPLWIAVEG